MNSIAFFDFDGTITNKDSMIDFIVFSFGYLRFFIAIVILSPIFIAFKIKLISNSKAKNILLSYFFKGMSLAKFNELSSIFTDNRIKSILKEDAIKKINWHKKKGHLIVVVTASISNWVKPWCDKNNIKLIATELEIYEDTITGRFSTKNCYGREKVKRIKEDFDLSSFEIIYIYGDSKGDNEMFEIGHKKYYRSFS